MNRTLLDVGAVDVEAQEPVSGQRTPIPAVRNQSPLGVVGVGEFSLEFLARGRHCCVERETEAQRQHRESDSVLVQ